jgi:hypothetical protein
MMNLREMAKKAVGGDSDATEVILITVPKGVMKGMDPMEFIQKFAGDMEFGGDIEEMLAGKDDETSSDYMEEPESEDDMAYKAKHKAVMEALSMAGVPKKEAHDIATKVCGHDGGMSEDGEYADEDTTDPMSA